MALAVSTRARLPLLLIALSSLAAAPRPSAAAPGPGCPAFQAGVLAMHNNLRAQHNAPPLKWDAALAAKAQAHADRCKWTHSGGRTLYPNGESIYSSGKGTVKYPFRGMDVCSWATYALYLEGTSYAYDKPGTSRDPGVPIGHFVNIVWSNTTRLGCAYTNCSSMDFVVCWYGPGFYASGGSNATTVAYKDNVLPHKCQLATGDGWCSACSGSTCTACWERPAYGQPMSKHKIQLDAARKRCVSACPASVQNCQQCDFADRCLKCKAGWAMDAQRRCTVRAPAAKKPGRRRV